VEAGVTGRRPPRSGARTARYEARYEGGGRFRIRRKARWPATGVAAAAAVGAGVLSGLWHRLAAWAGHATHRGGTLAVAALLAALVWWVWRRTG
jgi:hypothetical protein